MAIHSVAAEHNVEYSTRPSRAGTECGAGGGGGGGGYKNNLIGWSAEQFFYRSRFARYAKLSYVMLPLHLDSFRVD